MAGEPRFSVRSSTIDHAQILDSLEKDIVVIESGFKG